MPVLASADASSSDPSAESQPPRLPWKHGPIARKLGHGAQIDLPAIYPFLAQPEAGQIMVKMGNLHNENLLGVIVPEAEDKDYFVTVRYDEEGYIKDDDTLDGDKILKAIRDGEEDYNTERKKAGFPAIHADGWKESPHYDKQKHQVIWALLISDSSGSSLNYNTRVLGRKGYVSLNLVTDVEHFTEHRPAAATLLHATRSSAARATKTSTRKRIRSPNTG